jgi:hypothetical protein
VVGYPHDVKGQGIYCYVTLMEGQEGRRGAAQGAGPMSAHEIGPIASPDKIQFAPGLPKTRSGKIMRRILRKIAEDEFSNLGDTSTLAEPEVVDDLINNRQNLLLDQIAGRSTQNLAPPPSRFSAQTLPRCVAMICFTMERPRPELLPKAVPLGRSV